MNTNDLDSALAAWLSEGPDDGPRAGLERALAASRSVRQRPGWTYAARWWPVAHEANRTPPARAVGFLLLIALMAVALAIALVAGSRPPAPNPLTPAANGLIAFELDGDIVVGALDGSQLETLNGDVAHARSPQFSPDGTLLAFISGSPADWLGGPIFVVPADGSRPPIDIGGSLTAKREYYPALAWSPDGRHIAFASSDPGTTAIVVAAADGSGARPITGGDAFHDLPSWSPDGSLIAYRIVALDRSSRSLAVARPDGSEETILVTVTGSEASLSRPSWSPDGTRLAVHQLLPDDPHAIVVDLDGKVTRPWPGHATMFADNPVPWSPNGRSLALLSDDGVLVVDVDGSNPRRLGNRAYCWLKWSPDGSAVFGPQGDRCGENTAVIPVAHPELTTTDHRGMVSWQRQP